MQLVNLDDELVSQGLDELFRVGSELKDLLLKDLILLHDCF